MNKSFFSKSIFAFFPIFLLFSCVEIPDFSNTPYISNARVSKYIVDNASFGTVDSLRISFDFQDGDGDLGDTTVKFNDFDLRKERIEKGDTILDNTSRPTVKFKYLFDQKIKNSPISGTVTFYYSESQNLALKTNDTIRYSIQIKDRKQNMSNKIYTPLVILNQK